MQKLTRYTSIEDLKKSNEQLQPQQSDLKYKSDLMEFISIMKKYSSIPREPKLSNPFNKSGDRK
jgi:hypothetical protein